MENGVFTIPARYKIEDAVDMDKSMRDIRLVISNVSMSKNRIWATDGHILVSLYHDKIPENAVGRLLSPEHFKQARKIAKANKSEFLQFKFLENSIEFLDGATSPVVMDPGYSKNPREYRGKEVFKMISRLVELVNNVRYRKENKAREYLALNPSKFVCLMEAMGAKTNNKANQDMDYCINIIADGENRQACMVTIYPTYRGTDGEKEDNIRRHIGLIMPIRIDELEKKEVKVGT